MEWEHEYRTFSEFGGAAVQCLFKEVSGSLQLLPTLGEERVGLEGRGGEGSGGERRRGEERRGEGRGGESWARGEGRGGEGRGGEEREETHISLYEFGEVGIPDVVHVWPLEQCHPTLVCLREGRRQLVYTG